MAEDVSACDLGFRVFCGFRALDQLDRGGGLRKCIFYLKALEAVFATSNSSATKFRSLSHLQYTAVSLQSPFGVALRGLGFKVWGLGLKAWGLGLRVWGLGVSCGLKFRAWGHDSSDTSSPPAGSSERPTLL